MELNAMFYILTRFPLLVQETRIEFHIQLRFCLFYGKYDISEKYFLVSHFLE